MVSHRKTLTGESRREECPARYGGARLSERSCGIIGNGERVGPPSQPVGSATGGPCFRPLVFHFLGTGVIPLLRCDYYCSDG